MLGVVGGCGVGARGTAGPLHHPVSQPIRVSVCPSPPRHPRSLQKQSASQGESTKFHRTGRAGPSSPSLYATQTEQETKLQEHEHMPWDVSAQKISSKRIFKNICNFFCSLALFASITPNFTLWHVSLELCVRAC